MLHHEQAFRRHQPENGLYGDCFRTLIACLLDLPRDDVPNFAEGLPAWTPEAQAECIRRARAWLAPERTVWNFPIKASDLATVMGWTARHNPDCRYIVCGGTRWKGVNHAVAAWGDRIEWNPFPAAKIISPMWPDKHSFNIATIGVAV